MKLSIHYTKDWCHICGDRKHIHVDIFYSKNAEHFDDISKYVRICHTCIAKITKLVLPHMEKFLEDSKN